MSNTSSLIQRTTHRLCITIPDVVLGQLVALSNQQGRSVSNLAAFLLEVSLATAALKA